MGHLFYFFGLIIFLSNIHFLLELSDYFRIKEWFKSFEKVTKRQPQDKDFKKGDLDKFKRYNGIIGLNFIWLFFGILTSSWKIFIILLLINITIDHLINQIGEFNIVTKLIKFLKNVLLTGSILLLCLNHFHLHLDLYKLLLGFIGR